jgi:GGDEF domain-containing protein
MSSRLCFFLSFYVGMLRGLHLQNEFRRETILIINEQNDAERRALREVTDQPAAPDWLLQECRRYGLDRDPLTGMPVNAHVINFINELVVRIQDGSLDCLCVYYLDLDHFKLINDTHGHAQGDEIIIAVGNRAHNFATRRRGMAARLNSAGDEFCVVIPDLDKEDSILVGFELHGKMIGNYR